MTTIAWKLVSASATFSAAIIEFHLLANIQRKHTNTQTMKNSTAFGIAGGIAVALSAMSIGGYAVYKASVHEQNCLSYERQIDSKLDEGVSFIDELATMKRDVDSNPFMAFAYLGKIGEVQMRGEAYRKAANDLGYAYRGTCGADRAGEFIDRPENKGRLGHISYVAGSM
jgi:hypothetical protein